MLLIHSRSSNISFIGQEIGLPSEVTSVTHRHLEEFIYSSTLQAVPFLLDLHDYIPEPIIPSICGVDEKRGRNLGNRG